MVALLMVMVGRKKQQCGNSRAMVVACESHIRGWYMWCFNLQCNKACVAQLARVLLMLLGLRVQFSDIVKFIFYFNIVRTL